MLSIISLQSNTTRRKANITEVHFLTECASRVLFFLWVQRLLQGAARATPKALLREPEAVCIESTAAKSVSLSAEGRGLNGSLLFCFR